MRWEMEAEDIEAVLEKIWDLHDKISEAIHSVTRTHFLNSIKSLKSEALKPNKKEQQDQNGFVFMKANSISDIDGFAEARSLNAIRTALENLEDQLEFFHTIQTQQRTERDAAIARLEQSRMVLAMRLGDHQGKKYKVIEEALAFVGDVRASDHFVAPENLYEIPRSHMVENLEDQEGKRSNILMQMLVSSLSFAKKSLKFERMAGVLGNAALIAVGMLALLQMHHVAFKSDFVLESSRVQEDSGCKKGNRNVSCTESSFLRNTASERNNVPYESRLKQLDVLSARG